MYRFKVTEQVINKLQGISNSGETRLSIIKTHARIYYYITFLFDNYVMHLI